MTSISDPMSADAAAKYYEKTGKEEYYLAEKGVYGGSLAENLELQDVTRENFRSLLDGKSPNDEQLVSASKSNDDRRAGWDVTFSAPKSLSILALDDPALKAAHEDAVQETMQKIENEFAITRVSDGQGGQRRINTGNLAYASFTHLASRNGDPQLHTHNFIMNMTQIDDSKYGALDLKHLYQNQKEVGLEYRSLLAEKIQDLGYEIDVVNRKEGFFEIRGVSNELIHDFSTRRTDIVKQVETLRASGLYPNATDARLHEIATLQTRPEKAPADAAEIRKNWDQRTMAITGQTVAEIRKAAQTFNRHANKDMDKIIDTAVLTAVHGLTDQEAVVSDRNIIHATQKLTLEHGVTGAQIQKRIDALNEKNELVRLTDRDITGSYSYSTPDMIKAEWRVLDSVRMGRFNSKINIDREIVKKYLEQQAFTNGQENAISAILSGNDRVTVIQGDAGTGKTAAMRAVQKLASENKIAVRGFSFTSKAVNELQDEAGIKSQTLASFLNKPEVSGRPEIWIVDEAGMVGAKDMAKTLDLAEKAGAKVALVGDVKQFLSISAGRSFEQAQEQLGVKVIKMDEAMRPKTEMMKEVFKEVAAGQTTAAINILAKNDRIFVSDKRDELMRAAVQEYVSSDKSTVILAARNRDRIEINSQVRNELVNSDRVEPGRTFNVLTSRGLDSVAARFADSYEIGDQLKMYERVSKISAGTTASVIAADPAKNLITLAYTTKDGVEHQVNIDPSRQSGKYAVYQKTERNFGVGDRIVTLANEKSKDENGKTIRISNGGTGQITELNGSVATIQFDNGTNTKINFDTYNYIDHAYAITEYKAQGATVDKTIIYADTQHKNNKNSFYVGITRGRDDVKLYTDNLTKLQQQIQQDATKTSTIDHTLPEYIEKSVPTSPTQNLGKVQVEDHFSTSTERRFNVPDKNIGAGFKSFTGWSIAAGGVGCFAEKNGLFGIGDISFATGNSEYVAGTKITTNSRTILTGEHSGSVVHSRTAQTGNHYGGHFSTTGSISKNGERISIDESGYHVDALLGKFTHNRRVETAKDGTKQISTTRGFLGRYWGEKTTVMADGTIKVTKWKGTRSFLTGKLKITHSVTSVVVDKAQAAKLTQPLSKRLFYAIAEKFYFTNSTKNQIDKYVKQAESKLSFVRDNISGLYQKTGKISRQDGTQIMINEVGVKQQGLGLVRRVENIISGLQKGQTKISEHIAKEGKIAGNTKIFLPNGKFSEKNWHNSREMDREISR